MTPQIQSKIFDPFFTTKEMGKGTGLGLAIAYRIVRSHEGLIDIESESSSGSCFRILFPLCPEVPERTVSQGLQEGAFRHREETATVLVVDDEGVIRNLVKNILVREGLEVILAEHGKQACEIVEQKKDRIDLVILDMIMPGMDDKETYDRQQGLSPKMPVIFSTGYSRDDPRRR